MNETCDKTYLFLAGGLQGNFAKHALRKGAFMPSA
jgi:hypothetical protein